MYKKTVLKQLGKLLPKNETIMRAIAEDNKDSVIGDRLEGAMKDSQALTMGAAEKKEETVPTTGTEGIIESETVKVAESTPAIPATPVVEVVKDLPKEDPNDSSNKKAMRAGMKGETYDRTQKD